MSMRRHISSVVFLFLSLITVNLISSVSYAQNIDELVGHAQCVGTGVGSYLQQFFREIGTKKEYGNIKFLSPAFNTTTPDGVLEGVINNIKNTAGISDFDDYFYLTAGNAYNIDNGGKVSDYVSRLKGLTGANGMVLTETGWFPPETGATEQKYSAAVEELNKSFGLGVEAALFFNAFGTNPDSRFVGHVVGGGTPEDFAKYICNKGINCSKVGVNSARFYSTPDFISKANGAGVKYILEIGSNDTNREFPSLVPALKEAHSKGITPIIRIGVGDNGGGFEEPSELVKFVKDLSAKVEKPVYLIIGPNEPISECWASPGCDCEKFSNKDLPTLDWGTVDAYPVPGNFEIYTYASTTAVLNGNTVVSDTVPCVGCLVASYTGQHYGSSKRDGKIPHMISAEYTDKYGKADITLLKATNTGKRRVIYEDSNYVAVFCPVDPLFMEAGGNMSDIKVAAIYRVNTSKDSGVQMRFNVDCPATGARLAKSAVEQLEYSDRAQMLECTDPSLHTSSPITEPIGGSDIIEIAANQGISIAKDVVSRGIPRFQVEPSEEIIDVRFATFQEKDVTPLYRSFFTGIASKAIQGFMELPTQGSGNHLPSCEILKLGTSLVSNGTIYNAQTFLGPVVNLSMPGTLKDVYEQYSINVNPNLEVCSYQGQNVTFGQICPPHVEDCSGYVLDKTYFADYYKMFEYFVAVRDTFYTFDQQGVQFIDPGKLYRLLPFSEEKATGFGQNLDASIKVPPSRVQGSVGGLGNIFTPKEGSAFTEANGGAFAAFANFPGTEFGGADPETIPNETRLVGNEKILVGPEVVGRQGTTSLIAQNKVIPTCTYNYKTDERAEYPYILSFLNGALVPKFTDDHATGSRFPALKKDPNNPLELIGQLVDDLLGEDGKVAFDGDTSGNHEPKGLGMLRSLVPMLYNTFFGDPVEIEAKIKDPTDNTIPSCAISIDEETGEKVLDNRCPAKIKTELRPKIVSDLLSDMSPLSGACQDFINPFQMPYERHLNQFISGVTLYNFKSTDEEFPENHQGFGWEYGSADYSTCASNTSKIYGAVAFPFIPSNVDFGVLTPNPTNLESCTGDGLAEIFANDRYFYSSPNQYPIQEVRDMIEIMESKTTLLPATIAGIRIPFGIGASEITYSQMYKLIEKETGVNCALLAGIHAKEAGITRLAGSTSSQEYSLISGRKIGEVEPDMGAGFRFSYLIESGIAAANKLKSKSDIYFSTSSNQRTEAYLQDYGEILASVSWYNGGGNSNCYRDRGASGPLKRAPLPDGGTYGGPCTPRGISDPYVTSLAGPDFEAGKMALRYCSDSQLCYAPTPFNGPGVLAIAIGISLILGN